MFRRVVLSVCVAIFSVATVSDAEAGLLYWINNDASKIQRGNSDGTGLEDLVTGITSGRQIALDPVGGHIYWTEITLGEIWRSNLDGSGAAAFITGLSSPYGVAVDHVGGRIFWTDISTQEVRSAKLSDGTDQQLLAASQNGVQGMVVDPTNQEIWWGQGAVGVFRITRADTDGSNAMVIASGPAPHDMAIDLVNKKLYWSNGGANDIERGDFDGSNIEDFAAPFSETGGVAVDPIGGKGFWSGIASNIYSQNLDKTDQQIIFAGIRANSIAHFNAVPEPSSLAMLGLALGAAGYSDRRRKQARRKKASRNQLL